MNAVAALGGGYSINVTVAEAAAALEAVFGSAFTNLTLAEAGALVDQVGGVLVHFEYGNSRVWTLPALRRFFLAKP
jgi:hypothetical protein